ncbi:MAG: hypothetical protein K2K21_12890 [Lachnospiraceae bacterium]|nr:hypothetical protein [Lachnospiraceae bacterium]
MTAHADGQAFNIDAELLPSENSTLDFMLTIENIGEDWEGTVRLMIGTKYDVPSDCAYDTLLTLPQGSIKQFVVSVPKESIYSTNEVVYVILLDKKSNVAAEKTFKRFEGLDAGESYTKYSKIPTDYNIMEVLGNFGINLDFTPIKFIMIVYVIIVGPVLYVILRFYKKRDFYWAAVPAASFAGVILIAFAGRGFEVESTRVYSVTMYNLAEQGICTTYMHCYDAGHKEWSLRLSEDYEYVGPWVSYSINDSYLYHIRKDGSRLFFGINPSFSFEDSYFCAGKAADDGEVGGSIDITISNDDDTSLIGTVANNTNKDFAYFAVVKDGHVWVYNGLPAGETSRLTDDELIANGPSHAYSFEYFMYHANRIRFYVEEENLDTVYALCVGVREVGSMLDKKKGESAIIGVVEDWDKAVDDDCSEVSYGCFYMFQ